MGPHLQFSLDKLHQLTSLAVSQLAPLQVESLPRAVRALRPDGAFGSKD
jgi:hypothetical protein